MRILFLNVLGSVSSDGSRLISALLKRAGHSVKSVYVKKANPELYPLEAVEVEQLHEVLKDAELVLMAVYSGYGSRTVQVTNFVRQNYSDLKIIWGRASLYFSPGDRLRICRRGMFLRGRRSYCRSREQNRIRPRLFKSADSGQEDIHFNDILE